MPPPVDPRLLRQVRAVRAHLVVTGVLGLATAGLLTAQAVLLAAAIAGVVEPLAAPAGEPARPVAPWGLLPWLAGVVAGRVGLAWAAERFGRRAALTAIAELRTAVLRHAVRLGPAATVGARGAAVTTLATRGLDALDGYLVRYLPQLVLAGIVAPALLVVVLGADLVAAITIAATLPLIPLFMALVGWSTQAAAGRRLRSMQRLGAQLLDLVAGLPTLRALGRDRAQAVRVRQVGEAYRAATMRTLRTAFLSGLVLELLTTLSVALVAVGIGLRVVSGGLDFRTALVVLLLAPEVYLPVRQVGAQYHASVDGLAAADQALDLLARPAPAGGTRPAPPLAGQRVSLREVTVRHPGRALAAPHRLSLDLAPGEVVALAGPSGAGKSSAIEVLLGLRQPDAGRVLIGPEQLDLAEVAPESWWRQVGWLPQRPVLAPGTLLENALLGEAGEIDPARLAAVARITGVAEFLPGLPNGWHTAIGGGGVGLSAGQRQRLALARVLLRHTPLTVLDEPTAHLDAGTEQRVLATVRELARAGGSVLVVAHRPSLLAVADRVVRVRSVALPAQVAA